MVAGVAARLGPPSAAMLIHQAAMVNRVQRFVDGKEVNLYRMAAFRATFEDSWRFPFSQEEELLAKVELQRAGTSRRLSANLWLARGRLFSIIYDKSPRMAFAAKDLIHLESEIVSVTVCWSRSPKTSRIVSSPSPSGQPLQWLDTLIGEYPQVERRTPRPEAEWSLSLECLRAFLPPDYVSLLSFSDGLLIGRCKLFRPEEVREVVTPSANYLVFGEVEELGVLASKSTIVDSEIYLLPYETDEITALGPSLGKALSRLAGN
jgi:hypothetical protein